MVWGIAEVLGNACPFGATNLAEAANVVKSFPPRRSAPRAVLSRLAQHDESDALGLNELFPAMFEIDRDAVADHGLHLANAPFGLGRMTDECARSEWRGGHGFAATRVGGGILGDVGRHGGGGKPIR